MSTRRLKEPQTRTPVTYCDSTIGLGTQRVTLPGRIKICGITALLSPEQMIFLSLNHTISLNHAVTKGIRSMYKKILPILVLIFFLCLILTDLFYNPFVSYLSCLVLQACFFLSFFFLIPEFLGYMSIIKIQTLKRSKERN